MFQDLLESTESVSNKDAPTSLDVGSFFDQPWPFQTALQHAQQKPGDNAAQIRTLLHGPSGLARLPKALIPFHRTSSGEHTAFEEHLLEALELAELGGQSEARVHFTLSPQHRTAVREFHSRVAKHLGESDKPGATDGGTVVVTDSSQHAATDTLSLTAAGGPLRTRTTAGELRHSASAGDGALVLRPGGHGSLLRNLEETNAAFVLVKNIDNVQPADKRTTTLHWKAALLGALALAQDEIFELTETLEKTSLVSDATTQRSLEVLARFGRAPDRNHNHQHSRAALLRQLDRPIRLCGVVPNQGEPGGGPFWVRCPHGRLSLQIAEGAQIDPGSAEQQAILGRSTHFNPVDLACALRNRHGDPYSLDRFRDDNTYFVATKSHQGQTIRALEHPGLWNGAMAHWLTLFVEAPLGTFTPVKTVWDLLRPEHQPGSV